MQASGHAEKTYERLHPDLQREHGVRKERSELWVLLQDGRREGKTGGRGTRVHRTESEESDRAEEETLQGQRKELRRHQPEGNRPDEFGHAR